MSDLTDLLDQAEAREERASDMVARICAGERWTMRVPVDEARDSDTVIAASLADVPRLTAALRAVEALAEELAAKCPPDDWGSGGIEDAIVADTARGFLSALAAALVPAAVAGDTDGEGER